MTNHDAQAFLEELLTKIGVSFERIESTHNNERIVLQVTTNDGATLLGNRAEGLRALNHIVRKAFETEDERLLVDVNGYHMKHIDELTRTARLLAERARSLKYNVEMQPMNAYDRLIVHAALTDEPNVTTESQGEGRERRVVIRFTE